MYQQPYQQQNAPLPPYPPQPYGQPYPGHYYAPQITRRSAIPKVMGILMIIFASLGLIGSLMGLVSNAGGRDAFAMVPALKTWSTIELLFSLFGLGIGFLHLIAGAKAVAYKSAAPRLAVTYAIVAMVSTITHSILFYAW